MFYQPNKLARLWEEIKDIKGRITFVAGATDLYVLKKDGLLPEPNAWVDISPLEELKGIREQGNEIIIGPLTTFSQLESSNLLRIYAPSLVSGSSQVGSPQIRNRGTLGGNIANASPAGDSIPALYATEARLRLQKGNRIRQLNIEEFFLGPGKTVLENGELITQVILPGKRPLKGTFKKLGPRKAQAISKVSLALEAEFKKGLLRHPRIALGAVGPTVLRARRTEEFLNAKRITRDILGRVQEMITREACPIDDFRSTAQYRCRMAGVLLKKALEEIL